MFEYHQPTFGLTYNNSFAHSPKGTTWKDHKYLKKDGGRYIYREIRQGIHTKAKNVRDYYKKKKTEAKIPTDVIDDVFDNLGRYYKEGSEAITKAFDKIEDLNIYDKYASVIDIGWEFMDSVLIKMNKG